MARTESQLNKQAKHTTFYNFSERISIAEHWKLVVTESSEFHLTLSRAHLECICSNSKYAKKRDILSQKRESGMTLKKAWVYARKRYCWHLCRHIGPIIQVHFKRIQPKMWLLFLGVWSWSLIVDTRIAQSCIPLTSHTLVIITLFDTGKLTFYILNKFKPCRPT